MLIDWQIQVGFPSPSPSPSPLPFLNRCIIQKNGAGDGPTSVVVGFLVVPTNAM